jgi:hypothetical protein
MIAGSVVVFQALVFALETRLIGFCLVERCNQCRSLYRDSAQCKQSLTRVAHTLLLYFYKQQAGAGSHFFELFAVRSVSQPHIAALNAVLGGHLAVWVCVTSRDASRVLDYCKAKSGGGGRGVRV